MNPKSVSVAAFTFNSMMDLSITSIFLLIPAVTANCTGQWWSTGLCWDRWREWSQSWRRTSEANGEGLKTMMRDWHVTKEERRAAQLIICSSPHAGLCGCPQLRSWSFLWGAPVSHTASRSVWSRTLVCFLFLWLWLKSLMQRWYHLKEPRSRSLIKVVRQFHQAGFMVDVNDDPGATLNKKIRSAQLAQYNYIFGNDGYEWWSHTNSGLSLSGIWIIP